MAAMAGQRGFFDTDERLQWLSAAGDPLERLAAVVDFELFRPELDAALGRSDRAKGGRPPYDAVMMFRVLVLQSLYTLSDDQAEYQLRDRLSFMRFAGLALHDAVPDAKTIWLFREQLVRAGAFERLFARFDAALSERGYLAMGGQIVDATIVEARRPRLTQAEKEVVKGGGVPEDWKPARTRQIDREGRWTLKRGKRKPTLPGGGPARRRRRPRSPCRCSATRTTSASTASTVSSAASPSPTPPPMTAPSSARCSTRQHRERRLGRHRLPLGGQHQDAGAARPEARVPARQAQGQADAAPHRPRQRPARPHPLARRARLRRPEAPLRPRDPHHRAWPAPRRSWRSPTSPTISPASPGCRPAGMSGKPAAAVRSRPSARRSCGRGRCRPRRLGLGPELPEGGSADQMALDVEGIVDGGMGGEEPLG
jgi:transposase